MTILIDKNTKVMTQGMTGKVGQFHTVNCKAYANGANCFVAGVNPKKAGELFEDIPVYASVIDAKNATGRKSYDHHLSYSAHRSTGDAWNASIGSIAA
jgi:succinyl-CoA synthetase alpha subunit